MEYIQIQKGRLADLVSNQLKESIFQGLYRPGQRIPTEHKLVEGFGVSRVIVREALKNLEQTGLIEIKRGPKGGAFVLPMRHDAVSQVIKDTLRLGRAKVADIMDETGLPRRTIQYALKTLTSQNFLQLLGKGAASRYQLVF